MKGVPDIGDLRATIDSVAAQIGRGEAPGGECFATDAARDAHREFVKRIAPPATVTTIALARVGEHYIAKLRAICAGAKLTAYYRWRKGGGRWQIAAVEDLSDKRSPWSDVPALAAARESNQGGTRA